MGGGGRHIGMPIGNLTSQLFANIYLNEFDRFVRHEVRPYGFVRYGDDFVLFGASRQQVSSMGRQCAEFLARKLFLEVHSTNNSVVKAASGIHFLGHRVYPNGVTVAPSLARKISRDITPANASGYSAQVLPRRLRRDLPWYLVEQSEAQQG